MVMVPGDATTVHWQKSTIRTWWLIQIKRPSIVTVEGLVE